MATVHEEIEVKYDASAEVRLPDLVELFGRLRGEPGMPPDDGVPWSTGEGVEHHLSATYYDTADLDLAAAGLTLRRREGGEDAGWHLKVPVADGARSEVRVPLDAEPAGVVPDRLVTMTYATTGGRPLVPVAQIETDRTVRRLVDATGRVLVEVADDLVTAVRVVTPQASEDPEPTPVTWREVEVELVDGPRELLAAVDPLLRECGLTPAASSSKLRRALGLDGAAAGAGTDAGATSGGPEVGAGSRDAKGPKGTKRTKGTKGPKGAKGAKAAQGTKAPKGAKPERRAARSRRPPSAAEVVLDSMRADVAAIRANDPLVRLDVPGAVHAMRVATRRLRSTLATFEPLFHATVTRPVARELKRLAAVLGGVRDAEVARERLLIAVAEGSGDAERHGTDGDEVGDEVRDEVRDQLDRSYRAAHDTLLAALDSERYRTLLDTVNALLQTPPLQDHAAEAALAELTRPVADSFAQVRSAMEAAADVTDPEARVERQHDARKAAKRARYAAESVMPVLGKDARRFAAAMEQLQTTLGEHLDSVNTRRRLRALAEDAAPRTAFAYGRLHAREEALDERSAVAIDDAWAAASKGRLLRWLE